MLVFSLAIVFGIFPACDKEDKTTAPQITTTIVGTYSLTNVSGGLQGADVNFSKGEIQWSFDTVASTLMVNNTIDTSDARQSYSDLPTGTYSFQFQTQNAQSVLFVDSTKRGPVTFTSIGFNLDDGIAADGFLIKFEK